MVIDPLLFVLRIFSGFLLVPIAGRTWKSQDWIRELNGEDVAWGAYDLRCASRVFPKLFGQFLAPPFDF